MSDENELESLRKRLTRAKDLLREWRDRYGGYAWKKFVGNYDHVYGASKDDVLRDTDRFLEGRE